MAADGAIGTAIGFPAPFVSAHQINSRVASKQCRLTLIERWRCQVCNRSKWFLTLCLHSADLMVAAA
jgi:hypothetical protein